LYPAARIATVYNGVETDRARLPEAGQRFRKQFGIPAERQLVIQVSWLVPEKGVEIFIKAASAVNAVCPGTHFAVIGGGPGLAEYKKLAESLGLADRLLFTELVRPTADGVFEAADVYCQLSQWEEACPLAIEEAMASGLPVVASRVGGIPELVADGETGFLVDRQDHADAARRIVALLTNSELRSGMSRASLARAQEHFDLIRNISRLLDEWGIDSRRHR
jgi:glycosyltransferase involved in cell wall biosynthesis